LSGVDFGVLCHEMLQLEIEQPDNKWNEIPWNRKPGETKFRPMSPPPPKPPVIRESCAYAAPFATRDNMVVLKVMSYPGSRPLQKPSRQNAALTLIRCHLPCKKLGLTKPGVMMFLQYGEGKPSVCNNVIRRRQKCVSCNKPFSSLGR
jgi:hypothetical protein